MKSNLNRDYQVIPEQQWHQSSTVNDVWIQDETASTTLVIAGWGESIGIEYNTGSIGQIINPRLLVDIVRTSGNFHWLSRMTASPCAVLAGSS